MICATSFLMSLSCRTGLAALCVWSGENAVNCNQNALSARLARTAAEAKRSPASERRTGDILTLCLVTWISLHRSTHNRHRYAVAVPSNRPPFRVMFGRAARLRCAWCGARRGIIRTWFRRYDSCQTCGLSVQRGQEGFELGSASVNAIVTFGAIIVAATISIIVTYPDIAVVPLLIVLGGVAIALPIALYPFTHTLWFAVELLMEPPSPEALADAKRRIAKAGAERSDKSRRAASGHSPDDA